MKKKSFVYIIMILSAYSCINNNSTSENGDLLKKSFVEKKATEVKVQIVKEGVFEHELVSNGRLSSAQKSTVVFKVQAEIKKINIKNGQLVKRNDILSVLDTFRYKKLLLDNLYIFEKAKINLEDQLLGYGYTSKNPSLIPKEIFKMVKLRSGYNQAKNNLNEAERNLSFTKVTAPISGVIANLVAQENNLSTQ